MKDLRIARLPGNEPEVLAELKGLGAAKDYVAGRFRGAGPGSVFIFEPGSAEIQIYAVGEGGGGALESSAPIEFAFEEPVRQMVVIGAGGSAKLLVAFGEGEKAGVFELDGAGKPKLVRWLETPTAEYWSGAATLGDQFVAFLRRPTVKFSSRYQLFSLKDGSSLPPADLTTLDENDLRIHGLIMANLQVTEESAMKVYTNTIPGTKVNYGDGADPGRRVSDGQSGGRGRAAGERRSAT